MNRSIKSVSRIVVRPLALAIIGLASLGVLGPAARADHNRTNVQDPVVIVNRGHHDNLPVVEYGRGRGGNHAHGRDCDCNGCHPSRGWAQQEYDLGVKAGRCEGFDEGYADALKGRCFDDCVANDLRGASKPFRDGYLWAFTRAYARGFEQGKCERSCERPSERSRGRGGWNVSVRW